MLVLDSYMNKMDAKMSLKGAHGSDQHGAAASTPNNNRCSRYVGQGCGSHGGASTGNNKVAGAVRRRYAPPDAIKHSHRDVND